MKYKNAQENINGSIDCLVLLGEEWVPNTQDPAIGYELSEELEADDWQDVKSCPQAEKDAHEQEQARDKVNQEALSYLASTDWYVIRQLDSGEVIPEGVKQLRKEARARVL